MSEGVTCRELIEFLDEYVAGTLAPDRGAAFERHLSACPACADYLRTYRDTIALSAAAGSSVPAPALPPALVAAILKARAGARESGTAT